jgi:septum formation topological specificity factor MinE
MLKNVKARRKAGATDSSSRLKLETAYDRARKLKPSGRLNVSDLRKVAKLSPAQRKKQLKRN